MILTFKNKQETQSHDQIVYYVEQLFTTQQRTTSNHSACPIVEQSRTNKKENRI